MKKILHITYDMRIGGTEMVIKNLVEGSSAEQYKPSIFCIDGTIGPWGKELSDKHFNVHCEQRKAGFDLSLIKKIRRVLLKEKIDIVHCHQYTPWVYGCFAALLTPTKVIFTEHGRFYPDSSSAKRKIVNPLLIAGTSKITAISAATAKALTEYEFIPEERVQVIYNGIFKVKKQLSDAASTKHTLGIHEDTTILGTIARFDPIKNHLLMLEAFKRVLVDFPNTKLLIVGDGPERSTLESFIKKHNLNKDVILTGYVNNPSNLLACMDVFLLSSLSEGTSMTLLEANSIGIPCVVTDAGGNAEIIRHNFNGLVTPNEAVEEFHQAIIKLMSDNSLLSTFSVNAERNYNERFTNEKMIESYQTLYKELS